MAYWLLRCKDGHTSPVWTIGQHWNHMSPGDGVAVWRSGKDGGVVAVGQVTGAPHVGTDEHWQVPVEVSRDLGEHPIARAALEGDPRFAHALILRMAGGRNPFPLSDEEWAAITDRVPADGPQVVATAVRGAAVAVAVGATAVKEALKSVVR